ncbi:adenylyl-sulfate kinase, partial [Frankia sp. AgB1.9]|uniref:adenylyl-sulfate kinase n=1 Tax=unclassified Frankia TaxID=2632575 RepID=UPI001931977E
RDRKGLYAKARRGELTNFTGIDSPYQPPDHAEIHLDASGSIPAVQSAELVVTYLRDAGILAWQDGA